MEEGNYPYMCCICEHELEDEDQYVDHMEKLPCMCIVCGYVTEDRAHMQQHIEGSFYKCSFCPNKSVVRKTFLIHVASHDHRSFKCKLCPETFNSKGLLVRHLRTHRSGE